MEFFFSERFCWPLKLVVVHDAIPVMSEPKHAPWRFIAKHGSFITIAPARMVGAIRAV